MALALPALAKQPSDKAAIAPTTAPARTSSPPTAASASVATPVLDHALEDVESVVGGPPARSAAAGEGEDEPLAEDVGEAEASGVGPAGRAPWGETCGGLAVGGATGAEKDNEGALGEEVAVVHLLAV